MRKVYIAIIILSFLLFPNLNSANMACGQVQNIGNESVSWLKVALFYSNQPNKTTSCQVSPQDNKYCCDPEDIQGIAWAIGKNLTAQIIDSERNIYASPVSLSISGDGYDLFSPLYPKKVLALESSEQGLYTNVTSFGLNISTISPFNHIVCSLISPERNYNSTLCTNCSFYSFEINNLTQGDYHLDFSANDSKYHFHQDKEFTIVDKLVFSRKFDCLKCRNDFLPGKSTNITITLDFNSSYPVSGELIEYIPIEWVPVDVEPQPCNSTHQMIKWHIENSTHFKKNYTLSTPDSWLTRKYSFQSSFEGISSEIRYIYTARFLKWKWLSIPKIFSKKSPEIISQQFYQNLLPNQALLIALNDSIFTEIVLIPSKPFSSLSIEIIKTLPLNAPKNERMVGLAILSDRELKKSNVFQITYKFSKSVFSKQKSNATSVSFEQSSKKTILSPSKEDSSYFYYTLKANATSVIWVHYPKEGKI